MGAYTDKSAQYINNFMQKRCNSIGNALELEM